MVCGLRRHANARQAAAGARRLSRLQEKFMRLTSGEADRVRRLAAGALLTAAVAAALVAGASAQSAEPRTAPAEAVSAPRKATEEERTRRLEALERTETLEPAVRQKAIDLYKSAATPIRDAQAHAAKAAALEQAATDAPEKIRRLKAQAAKPPAPPAEIPSGLSLAEMESRLEELDQRLTDRKKRSDELADLAKGEMTRRGELPGLIASKRDRLAETDRKISALAGSAEPPEVKEAQRFLLAATRDALEADIRACEVELATSAQRAAVLRAEQDAIARDIAELEAQAKAWQKAVHDRREGEGLLRVERFRQAEEAADNSAVRQVARSSRELAELLTGPDGLNEKRSRAKTALEETEQQRKKAGGELDAIKGMVADVGLTNVIGMMLREQKARLPDVRDFHRRSAARQAEISRVKMKLFELGRLKLPPGEVVSEAKRLVDAAQPPIPPERRQAALAPTRRALQDRQALLADVIQAYEEYRLTLTRLDTAEKRYLAQARELADYIDEHVLWIRSADPLGPEALAQTWRAARWLLDAGAWAGAATTIASDARRRPVPVALAVAVVGGLLVFRRRLRAALASVNEGVARRYPGSFLKTVWALLLTTLLAGTGPLAAWLLGWRLSAAEEGTSFAFAVGRGLMLLAALWFPMALVRQICREKGLAEIHFRWPQDAVRRTSRSLLGLMVVILPLVFVVGAIQSQGAASHKASLGRIATIMILLLAGVHAGGLLRPGGQLVAQTIGRRKGSWVYRCRHVWYPAATLAPLALAGAAAAGYYYTATQLSWRLLVQFWVAVALIVLNALLLRWLLIARRALALRARAHRKAEEDRRRREEQAPREGRQEAEPGEIDMAAVNVQTRRLARYLMAVLLLVSVWLIWADVLPALGIFRRITLWGSGDDAVTVAHVALAALALLLTVVAGRNIPGMLEITVLQRLHVEAGARYAVSALARYVIFVVGIVFAFGAIGIGWSHVQWLVAAMTVGLGFGLQEIFANFVSGLIILFERPIRVGDVVTVGSVTGTVTRIRMRATTITDWDCKELIVPNKEFITGQLVNWTLSDNVIRVVIPVGIAYGSDTRRAKSILLDVAAGNERVLDDPPPMALFTEFGDSSLNFELRVYVGGLQDYLNVRHDLHMAIDSAFRDAKIEIAFPQQDVHVRSIKASLPVEATLSQEAAGAKTVDPPPHMS
jgi:potassium efflux system protein